MISPANELLNNNKNGFAPGSQKDDVIKQDSAFKIEKPTDPINAFPVMIKEVINEWSEAYQLPKEFFIGGVLTAVSGAMGSAYKIRVKNGWECYGNIYMAIVGSSGIGKTPAINACLKPLQEKDNELANEYTLALAEAQTEELPKSEYPTQKQIIINNTTIEAVFRVMYENPKGVLCYQDELAGWVKSMNQYKNGNDVEKWLSFHNNGKEKVSRVTSESYNVPISYVSVIGGIQPGILKELAKNGNKDNGFLHRMLFAYPDNCKKPYLNDNEMNELTISYYSEIINKIYEDSNKAIGIGRSIYRLSERAYEAYKAYNKVMVDKANESTFDALKSLFAKIENHSLRFALILEILHSACKRKDIFIDGEISLEAMEGGILLAKYFEYTASKVFAKLFEEDPLMDLDENQLAFYNSLPTRFTTAKAVRIAEDNNFYKSRAAKQFLNNKELFRKVKQGNYIKLC